MSGVSTQQRGRLSSAGVRSEDVQSEGHERVRYHGVRALINVDTCVRMACSATECACACMTEPCVPD